MQKCALQKGWMLCTVACQDLLTSQHQSTTFLSNDHWAGLYFGLVIILILVHIDHNQIELVKSLKQRIDFDENVAKYKSLQVKK